MARTRNWRKIKTISAKIATMIMHRLYPETAGVGIKLLGIGMCYLIANTRRCQQLTQEFGDFCFRSESLIGCNHTSPQRRHTKT